MSMKINTSILTPENDSSEVLTCWETALGLSLQTHISLQLYALKEYKESHWLLLG